MMTCMTSLGNFVRHGILALLMGGTMVMGASTAPNMLLILADDLGFSDLGCFGGEIQTPNLDQLASNGLRFTRFYNTARCWPTRASLLTGFYAQQVRRDKVPGVASGGAGQRPDWAPLLSSMLKARGYRAYHSGKWHLDGMPIQNGFDLSYYLKDQGRFFNPQTHWLNDEKLPPVLPGSDYYGTNAIAEHAVACLKKHAMHHASIPFFHYLAFTAPHFPLHALPSDIEKYRGVYDRGWDEMRRERWVRLQSLGLSFPPLSNVEPLTGPPYHFPEALKVLGGGEVNRAIPWGELSLQQKRFQASKMALHAAMVDRMDQAIGRVLQQLKDMDAWDNTLIVFLSDNGASAEIMVRDDGHHPEAMPGSAETYLCLGPGWSTVANTPFRKHKTWVHEGGIHTSCIMHWPQGIMGRGTLVNQVAHVVDMVPTLLALSGDHHHLTPVPGLASPPLPGINLMPVITDPSRLLERPRPLWWLHEGNRALRDGDWKLVATKGSEWELFDLGSDPNETRDLARRHPSKVRALARSWKRMELEINATALGQ
ncbi:MAG: arylsulfatase [Verrucomicrobiota bacterium]|nr:arylsulfatase [Verrucomicrobiota bacterium]